jgi:hypothetical protein
MATHNNCRRLGVFGPDPGTTLRVGAFIDRAEKKAVAVMLNPANNKYALMTKEERDIARDEFDALFDVVDAVFGDIGQFAQEIEERDVEAGSLSSEHE